MIGILCADLDANGGLEIVTKRLYNAFKEKSIDVKLYSCKKSEWKDVISFGINTSLKKDFVRKLIEVFIKDKITELIVQLSGPYDLLNKIVFYRLLKSSNIRVFVVLHNSPKSFITRYRNILDNKFIACIKLIRTKLILQFQYRFLFRKIAKYAHFVTISEGNRKELEIYYRLSSFVIPNYFEVSKETRVFCKKKNSLAYVGRIDYRQKNLLFLIKSWRLIKDKKDWCLHIIGAGTPDDIEILKKYIHQNKIDNIVIEGAFSSRDIDTFLGENSILVLTSFFEGFPTVVLEAASNSNAFVVTKYDGFSDEILCRNENCFITDFKEYEFSEKIQLLINNESLLKKFQNKAYVQFLQYVAEIAVVEKWMNLFQSEG